MKQAKPETRLRTATEARAEFKRKGISISSWAVQNQVPTHLVYAILGGNPKCRCERGISHRIAVLLRLKEGELA